MDSLPSIFEARNILKDPAPAWRWCMAFPTDIQGFNVATYRSDGGFREFNTGLRTSGGLIRTPVVPFGRVQDIVTPHISIDSDDRFVAGQMIHYPRRIEVDEVQINLYEDINYNSFNYLSYWRNMVIDRKHNYFPSARYKKNLMFFAFDHIDSKSPRLTGIIKKAFPKNPGSGLQYELSNSGLVVIPCTLSVTDVEWVFNPRT